MKKTLRKIAAFLMTVSMAVTGVMTAFAEETYSDIWKEGDGGVWYAYNRGGEQISNAWLCDDAVASNGRNVWYLMGRDGKMISAGLVQDGTGNYYSIETNHNGRYGMLRWESGVYDGIYLELESSHNGSFAAIRNQEGIEALRAKYGVLSVADIDNSNIVSSSAIVAKKSAVKVGGAGGAGGSGGGSSKGSGVSISYRVIDTSGVPENASEEEQEVIDDFVSTYITDDMSDFEKEMVIVKWMADHIEYDTETYKKHYVKGDGWNPQSYTSYGALVNGLAVCNGYALAFNKIAKACGLQTIKIDSNSHAWNQIKLDGKWYHVDVTYFDEDKEERADGLYYAKWCYLNMSDAETEKVLFHDKPWTSYHASEGGEYGTKATDAYFTGKNDDVRLATIEKNMDSYFSRMLEDGTVDKVFIYRMEDGYEEKVAAEIIDYINENIIDKEELKKNIAIRCDDESWAVGNSQKQVNNSLKRIAEIVNAHDFTKNRNNLLEVKFGLMSKYTSDRMFKGTHYYLYGSGQVTVEFTNLECEYTVTFIDEDEKVVDTVTGVTAKTLRSRGNVFLGAPENYVFVKDSHQVTEGDGWVDSSDGLIMRPSTSTLKVTIRVTKEITYFITCISFGDGIILELPKLRGRIGDPIKFPEIEGYECAGLYGARSDRDENILYAFDNNNNITIRYISPAEKEEMEKTEVPEENEEWFVGSAPDTLEVEEEAIECVEEEVTEVVEITE